MTDPKKYYLTQDQADNLRAELKALYENRPVIAAEINDRREEGDLKENAGYDAAREQQGQEEARIRQLEEILQHAEIGAATESGVALVGSVVHVYYDGDEDDKETFLIGNRAADTSNPDLETYSADAPLGKAIIGARVGETRTYTAPNGTEISVTIVEAEPYDPNHEK
ncbi:transcription elongation factor GreA [Corynebacterium ulceribovis]|uniref:transcription elongation factor GreA n=1 Tax=Corynebacterium ulceribovis TaxID=487732 RepID=UPI00037A54D5|nr:transcription elongation factor GreA [Corynebacterium ulceribovis]